VGQEIQIVGKAKICLDGARHGRGSNRPSHWRDVVTLILAHKAVPPQDRMSLGLGFPQFGGSPGFTEHNLDVVHEEVMECFPVFRKMKVTAYCDKAMALGQGRNNRTTQPLLLLSLKFARLELLYEVLKILVYRCGRTDAKIDACRPVALNFRPLPHGHTSFLPALLLRSPAQQRPP